MPALPKTDHLRVRAMEHEFWRVEQNYCLYQHLMNDKELLKVSNEHKAQLYTVYGQFLCGFYEFLLRCIERDDYTLAEDAKKKSHELAETFITGYVDRMLKAKIADLNPQALKPLFVLEQPVPSDFAQSFRRIRNRFSHTLDDRIEPKGISLAEFYNKYHYYVELLFQGCRGHWKVKDIESSDWGDVFWFLEAVNQDLAGIMVNPASGNQCLD